MPWLWSARAQTGMNKKLNRMAISLTLAASLVLIWLSLGVGIIGADGDPANLMYFGVIGIGIFGGIVSRLKPAGMAYTLLVMAIAQGLILAIALIAGLGLPWSGPLELILLNGFFIAMFLLSAWLFLAQHESN